MSARGLDEGTGQMEFAEWVVTGLDQLRIGQLPGGQVLFDAASAGLGGAPVLSTFMNTGDPAARAELVQAVARAVAANPGFEQQLRQAAATAQGGPGTAKPSFFKTGAGKVTAAVAAVVVVVAGIGLTLGLSGDDSVTSAVKGTWTCRNAGSTLGAAARNLTVTIGDGTWSSGTSRGTWKQDGGKVTITSPTNPDDGTVLTGIPSKTGSFSGRASELGHEEESVPIQGDISDHNLTLVVDGGSVRSVTFTCTK